MNSVSSLHADLTSDNVVLSLPLPTTLESNLTPADGNQNLQSIAKLNRTVSDYITAAIADNTRRAYTQDLEDFRRWGGEVPCSPETLATFIAERAVTLSPQTLTRRVVGISRAHLSQGFIDPSKNDLVRTLLRGIRRKNGKPQRQVAPLLKQDLMAILTLMIGTKGLRDRALVLLGFAAALRRSELVALDIQDLEFVREGLVVHLRRSKTDQKGEGRKIAVPFGRTAACPVKAIEHWIEYSDINDGAIFRSIGRSGEISCERLSPQSVALIIKGYVKAAGLPESQFSGHSLRSGLVTSAAQAGVSSWKIRQQTGHKSDAMLQRYIRDSQIFIDNAAGVIL